MIRFGYFFTSLAFTTCVFLATTSTFADAPDLDNLFIEFDAPSLGTGATTSPFKYLNFAAIAANNSANIHIESGTSSERLIGDSALGADSKPLTLLNNTPENGVVTIGLGTDTPAGSTAIGHPTLMSPHSSPIISHGDYIYVVNTPADTLDVINASTLEIDLRINVGIDPVSLAARPDGNEIWVSNHVSDSVSVIDTDPASVTYHQIIATVQDFDPITKGTRFDEPVGIAFASNTKAYVALSSENQIAVIDVATHTVTNNIDITAQDPRSIFVRDGFLYVIPFESQNQTQISGGRLPLDSPYETFDVDLHVLDNNNVLSLGAVVDIVKHPDIPDRDLYIFDTATDTLVDVIEGLGTLLYDLTVDSNGSVYIAQADARNDANGLAGSGIPKHGLAEMENRAFLNTITRLPSWPGSYAPPVFYDLEPLPPMHPAEGYALATPYAIEISDDDSTLFATAAGSDKLFTVNASTGVVLGRVAVGEVPRGIALESDGFGAPSIAWVLNAVDNTVSRVDVSAPANPFVVDTVTLDDPTHPVVKRGRIAFNDANMSSTRTFSCESCHPDGHADQLVWVLDTPIVNSINPWTVPGDPFIVPGDQIQPRVTMPARGLRDTAPYHWDGIPGDPYGGNNAANLGGINEVPNSDINVPASSTRFLVDGGLGSTMKEVTDNAVNDEGKAGYLSGDERDDMADFLLNVPYPPAQRRAFDNVLTQQAVEGFELFHIRGAIQFEGDPNPNVCGDCHRMPFWTTTNTPGVNGMDAPTFRGAYDRWLITPQGRQNIIDLGSYAYLSSVGVPERTLWGFGLGDAFGGDMDSVWEMVTEGSTGHSGSFARQVTLNSSTATNADTIERLAALELSASEGAIILQGEGVFIAGEIPRPIELQFDWEYEGGTYVERVASPWYFTRDELLAFAGSGQFVGTFTARIGTATDADNPQPAIWVLGPIHTSFRTQHYPTISSGRFHYPPSMEISGRHVAADAYIIVDGRRTSGSLSFATATHPLAANFDQYVTIEIDVIPEAGMHMLQLQNPDGLMSNDFIFFTQ